MASHPYPVLGDLARSRAARAGLDPRASELWRIIGEGLMRAGARALLWHKRISERRELASLDHRMLRDIGLSRTEVEAEWRKPFWRA